MSVRHARRRGALPHSATAPQRDSATARQLTATHARSRPSACRLPDRPPAGLQRVAGRPTHLLAGGFSSPRRRRRGENAVDSSFTSCFVFLDCQLNVVNSTEKFTTAMRVLLHRLHFSAPRPRCAASLVYLVYSAGASLQPRCTRREGSRGGARAWVGVGGPRGGAVRAASLRARVCVCGARVCVLRHSVCRCC